MKEKHTFSKLKSLEYVIVSLLSILITFTVCWFFFEKDDTKVWSNWPSIFNNVITPIGALISAYFIVEQFRSQKKVNDKILEQMDLSIPKLYIEYFTKRLDLIDKRFNDIFFTPSLRNNSNDPAVNYVDNVIADFEGILSLHDIIVKISRIQKQVDYHEIKLLDFYNQDEVRNKLQSLVLLLDEFNDTLSKVNYNIHKGRITTLVGFLEGKVHKIGKDYFEGKDKIGINYFIEMIHSTNRDIINNKLNEDNKKEIESLIDNYLIHINHYYNELSELGFISRGQPKSYTQNKNLPDDAVKWSKPFKGVNFSPTYNENFKFKRNNTILNS